MGCGLAIIARRVGNIPAYVTDGVNGLLFDKDEQLTELLSRLISDSKLRERLAESANRSATGESIWEQFALASVRS